MTDCPICQRGVSDEQGLKQHFLTKHPRCYCARCQQRFPSRIAKKQHVAASPKHNLCSKCSHKPDFLSTGDLDEHDEDKHTYCTPCERNFNSPGQLIQHGVEERNMCETCKRCFDSSSALLNHLKTHARKTQECPGCTELFVCHSAIVLHLEAGNCESGADDDRLNEIAFECYGSERYTHDEDPEFDFECATCTTPFRFMSALLQHVESETCDERVSNGTSLGKFTHFLMTQHGGDWLQRHPGRPEITTSSRNTPVAFVRGTGQATKATLPTERIHKNQSRGVWSGAGDWHCVVGDDHSICDKDCGWCGHCADGLSF